MSANSKQMAVKDDPVDVAVGMFASFVHVRRSECTGTVTCIYMTCRCVQWHVCACNLHVVATGYDW